MWCISDSMCEDPVALSCPAQHFASTAVSLACETTHRLSPGSAAGVGADRLGGGCLLPCARCAAVARRRTLRRPPSPTLECGGFRSDHAKFYRSGQSGLAGSHSTHISSSSSTRSLASPSRRLTPSHSLRLKLCSACEITVLVYS